MVYHEPNVIRMKVKPFYTHKKILLQTLFLQTGNTLISVWFANDMFTHTVTGHINSKYAWLFEQPNIFRSGWPTFDSHCIIDMC